MADDTTIATLVLKRLNDSINETEQQALDAWISESPANQYWFSQISSEGHLRKLIVSVQERELEKSEARVLARLNESLFAENVPTPVRMVHRVHFLRTAWFRVAVAGILFFGIGVYLWLQPSTDQSIITKIQPVPLKNDLLPGSKKAILTLADGQQLQLDSTTNNLLAEKGIINRDASITYSANGQVSGSAINTLTTPKGGQYQIKLSDGTMVWLNAASSITYPMAFAENKREVTITGEAYFEVAKNKTAPFVVNTNKENITVLGTSFNVNRYSDEPAGRISLVEGSVKVNDKILRPGQAYSEGKITRTNISQDIAWKNGVFDFNDQQLQQIMRQIARWYDVDIIYHQSAKNIEFVGKMSRQLTLSEVIAFFNRSNINMRMNGKQLIIE